MVRYPQLKTKAVVRRLMKMCPRRASPRPRTLRIHLLCAESFGDFMSQFFFFSAALHKNTEAALVTVAQAKQGGRYAA